MTGEDAMSTNTLDADVIVNIVFGIIATVLAVAGIVAAVRFRGQRASRPQAGISGRERERPIPQGTHFPSLKLGREGHPCTHGLLNISVLTRET